MVQQEVADRIVAPPGQMSLLAVSVRAYGVAERVCRVPPDAFYPAPSVSSAILVVRVYPTPLVPEEWREPFFRVVRAGFQQKRKQLRNSLAALGLDRERVDQALKQAAINPAARPQELDVEDWFRLTKALFPEHTLKAARPEGE
jgi:16S rRNA (adenine1518-N6/adenine1519-N6)-dimethyltransferase